MWPNTGCFAIWENCLGHININFYILQKFFRAHMVGFAGAGPFFTYPNDLLTFVGGIWNTNSIVKKDPHLWCQISSVASILNTNSHVTKDLDPWRQDLLLSPPATRTATKEEQPQSTSNNTTTISRQQWHCLPAAPSQASSESQAASRRPPPRERNRRRGWLDGNGDGDNQYDAHQISEPPLPHPTLQRGNVPSLLGGDGGVGRGAWLWRRRRRGWGRQWRRRRRRRGRQTAMEGERLFNDENECWNTHQLLGGSSSRTKFFTLCKNLSRRFTRHTTHIWTKTHNNQPHMWNMWWVSSPLCRLLTGWAYLWRQTRNYWQRSLSTGMIFFTICKKNILINWCFD